MADDPVTTGLRASNQIRGFRLRVVTSGFFAVLTLLLCVLWVRSYRCYDYAMGHLTATADYHVYSSMGVIAFTTLAAEFPEANFEGSMKLGSTLQSKLTPGRGGPPGRLGFRWMQGPGKSAQVPYWSIILLSALASGAPWIRSRFSLRMLLVAMTLVAILLGLLAWASR
jgi:hypothetical protein